MKRQIAELEQTLVQPRSWELQGETTGASREENGLLEVDLDVDRIGVSAPVSTVESTLSLEDMIKVGVTHSLVIHRNVFWIKPSMILFESKHHVKKQRRK